MKVQSTAEMAVLLSDDTTYAMTRDVMLSEAKHLTGPALWHEVFGEMLP
jgi:hypothetical protein